MRISIVTLAYNNGRFVEDAIQSVLSQEYPDLEYIVIEPGSTDDTRAVVERYRDRLQGLITSPDDGPADGLNKGFAAATGEVFGFLNADDLLLPGALRKVADAFARRPDSQIISGHIWIIDENGRRVRRSYTDPFDPAAFAYRTCTIGQQSTFVRAAAFRRAGGFNPGNRVAWDAELFLRILSEAKSMTVLDEFLGAFRIHPASITGSRQNRDLHRAYFERRFRTVMGREWRRSDELVRLLYYGRKYLLSPHSLYERVLRGSIIKGRIAPKF
ncbi:glycosyltransferase family 2 protein [Sulfuriferula sp.]|uniref:glycosyltransferase family 2 protein n=1 Tax=Sulfuriferula sp. TaxID=2025307 RepID=UPI0027321032|nr:glycosyltransferase family 2 protein [Sulfuriferula sp.]MDP2024900.1 glycosyltransferase family 2 protein [Sulfuriferula sp.]